MVGNAVGNKSHADFDAGFREIFAEHDGAIRFGENRLIHVHADFPLVHVERGDYLDITGQVAAQVPVHQSNCFVILLITIVIEALDQGARTVSNSDNRYFYLVHMQYPC